LATLFAFPCWNNRLAAAESSAPFEYKGLLGHMTIKQANDYDGHSLACETDTVVAALVRCHDHSTTYLGKPAILKIEFIDGTWRC
jgi:hypothetical protein